LSGPFSARAELGSIGIDPSQPTIVSRAASYPARHRIPRGIVSRTALGPISHERARSGVKCTAQVDMVTRCKRPGGLRVASYMLWVALFQPAVCHSDSDGYVKHRWENRCPEVPCSDTTLTQPSLLRHHTHTATRTHALTHTGLCRRHSAQHCNHCGCDRYPARHGIGGNGCSRTVAVARSIHEEERALHRNTGASQRPQCSRKHGMLCTPHHVFAAPCRELRTAGRSSTAKTPRISHAARQSTARALPAPIGPPKLTCSMPNVTVIIFAARPPSVGRTDAKPSRRSAAMRTTGTKGGMMMRAPSEHG
jgi:hypothetical protein